MWKTENNTLKVKNKSAILVANSVGMFVEDNIWLTIPQFIFIMPFEGISAIIPDGNYIITQIIMFIIAIYAILICRFSEKIKAKKI